MGILSLLIFLPITAAIGIQLLPKRISATYKWINLGVALVQFLLFCLFVLPVYLSAEIPADGYALTEKLDWLNIAFGQQASLSIDYYLGLDGMNVLLVGLSTLVCAIAALSSFKIDRKLKAYHSLFLLMNACLIGTFAAQDFFLFYIFFEFMLLPMFFLIGIWGGKKSEYAAIKFFLYTLFGSIFMLLVMVGLAITFVDVDATAAYNGISAPDVLAAIQNNTDIYLIHSLKFDQIGLVKNIELAANAIPGTIFSEGIELLGFNSRSLAFFLLLFGFAIKLPAVPVHTWLPDAHVQAPTPISVALAGILLKIGGYGIMRLCFGLFGDASGPFLWWMGLFGIIAVVYAALVALAQKDLKSLIAYSTVSHMGFVLFGIAAVSVAGWSGAMLQMFNHGIIASALFLLVGALYDRTQDRMIANYQGLWTTMPKYAVYTLIAFFASLGLPALSSFVSEMMIFYGGFASDLPNWMTFVAIFGIILAAAYYLSTFKKMFFGAYKYSGSEAVLQDLNTREHILLIPLMVLMILPGLFPSWFTGIYEASLLDKLAIIQSYIQP